MSSLVLVLAGAAMCATPSLAAPASLDVPWTYHPAGRPMRVTVTAPADDGAAEPPVMRLVLMDPDGNLRAEPADVDAGQPDLAALFPALPKLRRAAYLQLFVDDEPVGSSLVVQPMLSRLVPVTEDAVNPNGIKYTRIVDWIDEVAGATDDDEDSAESDADAGDDRPTLADPWLANRPPDGRLFSGVRLYPERDVRLRTTLGDIHLAMRPDMAPNTVWNFLELCEGGFYRSIPFHRIVPMTSAGQPFVIQAGDPTPSGSGGPGYWLPMEQSALPHDFGVISMARDVDPDSAGSQIFICLSREGTARLDGHYCSFGRAVDGEATILDIARQELADVTTGRPVVAPLILGADLLPAPPRRPGEGRPDRPLRRDPPRPEAVPDRVPR